MTNITKKTLIAAGVIAALGITATTSAFAADVPAGVQLADKQEIVKNNGSEVQSLDPHKIEGVPENNVTRDLMEGLANNSPNGSIVPGVAESWDNKDFKVWAFHLRKDAKWSQWQAGDGARFRLQLAARGGSENRIALRQLPAVRPCGKRR